MLRMFADLLLCAVFAPLLVIGYLAGIAWTVLCAGYFHGVHWTDRWSERPLWRRQFPEEASRDG